MSNSKPYNNLDPQEYSKMYETIPKEIYMKEHWCPLIEKLIEKYCENKKVLDLGCGYGKYTRLIQQYSDNVIGVDISKRWLSYAKTKMSISNLLEADAHNIPLKDESIDIIMCIGLFEYINREIVIREMRRILKRDGFGIYLVPNKYSGRRMVVKLFYKIFKKTYSPKEPSKKEMCNLFQSNNLELLEYKMDDGLIWLPNFIDRLCGNAVYLFIEKLFKTFRYNNPVSDVMLFIVRKKC